MLFYRFICVICLTKGCKIEANTRKAIIRKLKAEVEEGKIYKFVYFVVVNNNGKYKVSSHENKVLLNSGTKVVLEDCEIIPRAGFSLMNSADITLSDYMIGMLLIYVSNITLSVLTFSLGFFTCL